MADSVKTEELAGTDNAKRRQILEGARRVFMDRGFDGASMGEIARVAGVSKGTLYVYFDSKQALFAAQIAEEKRRTAETLFEIDASNHDVAGVLRGLAQNYLAMMLDTAHLASLRAVIGVAGKFPEVGQALFEAGPQNGARRLAVYFTQQCAAGVLSIEDTELAAFQFFGLLHMTAVLPALFTSPAAPDAKRRLVMIESAVDVFLAAYGAEKKG